MVSRFAEVARAVALLGSAVLAFSAVIELVLVKLRYHSLVTRMREVRHMKGFRPSRYGPYEDHYSFLITLHKELPVLWLAVFVLLAVGWWPLARILAVCLFAFAATDVTGVATAANEQLLLLAVTTGATLLVRGPAQRRVGGRRALLAAFVPAAAVGVLAVGMVDTTGWVDSNPDRWGNRLFHELFWGRWVSPDSDRAVIATVVLFIAVATLAFRSAVWPLAVAVVGLAGLGLLAAQAYAYDPTDLNDHSLPESGGVTEAAIVAVGLLTVALFALLRERRAARPTPTSAK